MDEIIHTFGEHIYLLLLFNLHKRNWFCLHFYFGAQFSCGMTGVDGQYLCTSFSMYKMHRLSVRGIHTTDTIFLLHGVKGRGDFVDSCRVDSVSEQP